MLLPTAAEEPKGAMGQNWRWRVLTADVLHACPRRDTIIAPNQASQLSGAVEIRMWSAADAQQQKQRSPAESEKEPGSSAQHEGVLMQPPQLLLVLPRADSRSKLDWFGDAIP